MAEAQKVYVVHLSITELLRGTNQSSQGNTLTGLWVRGTCPKDGGIENWEKFLMDWNAAESIASIEQAGVGAQVDTRMFKEGRFWNIQSVTNIGAATGPPVQSAPQVTPPPVQTPPLAQSPPQQQQPMFNTPAPVVPPVVVPAPVVASLAVDVRVVALNKACDLTMSMIANGILKGAKMTPQIIHEGTIILANKIVEYLENGDAVTPKSDTTPLEREPGCDDGDPGVDEDTDIPF